MTSTCDVIDDLCCGSVIAMRERVRDTDAIRCVGYGHIGDGNMHLNITSKQFDPRILDKIEPFLFEFTRQHGGSISAEHGEYAANAQVVTEIDQVLLSQDWDSRSATLFTSLKARVLST